MRTIATGSLLIMSGLLMGNQGCETGEQTRVLKIESKVSSIRARNVILDKNQSVDFGQVANDLFYREVMNHGHFVLSEAAPITTGNATTTKSLTSKATTHASGLSNEGLGLLQNFGFIRSEMRGSGVNAKAMLSATAQAAPACLYQTPRLDLSGAVHSFLLKGGFGVSVGYDGLGNVISLPVGASVEFSSSELNIGLDAVDPLTQKPLVIGDGHAYQNAVKFGIDLGAIPVGLDFFYKTGLDSTIRKSFSRALDQIVGDLNAALSTKNDWNDVWESVVIFDPVIANNDTHIALRGGWKANIKAGDQFYIYNMHYKWTGAECGSRLDYKVAMPAEPIALVKAVSVAPDVTVAHVEKILIEDPIRAGAMVRVQALVQPVPAKDSAK